MGCQSARELPRFDHRRPMESGSNKDVHAGFFRGQPAAICIAKTKHEEDRRRIENEIWAYDTVGDHEHVVRLLHAGSFKSRPYLVLESVEPVGYDLQRLYNQYAFLGQQVPCSLMARLSRQVAHALLYMHSRGVLHLDMKAENVLVTGAHTAKLCDMGIACEVGRQGLCLRAPYLAPELCQGAPLGPEVDAWGLGLVLHQIYQKNVWRLVYCRRKEPVRMEPGMPGTKGVDPAAAELMAGLLRFEASERLTLAEFLESKWLEDNAPAGADAHKDWVQPRSAEAGEPERKHLRRYLSARPPPTALAVRVGAQQQHLAGRQLRELDLPGACGATVVLLDRGGQQFVTCPGDCDRLLEGDWAYLGIPQGEAMEEAVESLQRVFAGPAWDASPGSSSQGTLSARTAASNRSTSSTSSTRASSSGSAGLQVPEVTPRTQIRRTSKQKPDSGTLLAFTLEFDFFAFPKHIGEEALVGSGSCLGPAPWDVPQEMLALDLRGTFGINIVGVLRKGEAEPEWFPGPRVRVRPGDLGLVARQPSGGGYTRPTLSDRDLEPLLDARAFQEKIGRNRSKAPEPVRPQPSGARERVTLKSAEGEAGVRLLARPLRGAGEVGEVPSGEQAWLLAAFGDEFVRVKRGGLEGWVRASHIDKVSKVFFV